MKVMRFRKMNSTSFEVPHNEYHNIVAQYQKADLAFQANKFSRWDDIQKKAYITALVCGKAPSKFIFADVEACLESAIESGVKGDIKYYQHWKDKGVKYLNVDSNNRNNVIVAFEEGNVNILHGEYDIDGAKVIVDSDSDTYKTLPLVLRRAFDEAVISITVYTDATRAELSDLFICVNEGKPLTKMEMLNSYITVVANTVRKLAMKHEDYFAEQGKWFTDTALNRRHVDEMIAECAFVYAYGLKKSIKIEDLYRDGSDGESTMSSFHKTFNAFMKDVMTVEAYAIANRNSVFDLFVIYMEMRNKKLKIDNNEEFLKSYIKVVANLILDEQFYEVPNAKEMKQFSKMVGGRQCGNNQKRNELIMESFDVTSLTTEMDSKRTFNTQEKMVLAALGDFKTPEGHDIEMSKLHTNDYHGGHVKPAKLGKKLGGTTYDNGVIQRKEDNLALGGKELLI
jgi:hypothetical protein